jgi:superfamily II RNA helicase
VLTNHLPTDPGPDALLDGFVDFVATQGIELYPAQEEAILELLEGNHVILKTPTGSGKSLVAAAAHFVALAENKRSVYTAPIKALVSEKFFSLRRDFGDDLVGMVTGDASINPDAPIICCTAEILANRALRDGANTEADVVIVDEFHYYADPQRGWAWQVPLLELRNTQFLLMSATLGSTAFFEEDLTRRTGRPTSLVSSDQRPVPLDFEYRSSTLHQSISELLESERSPIYLVHFTQRDATEAAQGYLSLDPLSKTEKGLVKEAIGGFRFDSPIGKDLRRYVLGGVGVHHAGLLPKYRLLVEKLAQQGLLKIICGTDTLGVGVNVPIRSVLFTQLCKYDGTDTRTLSNREFQQIAGRAGRKGFDNIGHVWVQAPAHVVENLRAEEKAASDPKKKKKPVKKKQPDRGYSHWTEDTFNKLVSGAPEPLTSSFRVNHQMVLTMLDRPGDGCAALRNLLTDNHETRKRGRGHIKRTISIYRSLLEANLLEQLDEPDEEGRTIRVNFDLQDEFALHQPLSLWAIQAIDELDPDDEGYALSVLTTVESVLESPGVIIAAQINHEKSELMSDMKSRGIEYEERMEKLAEVEAPKPEKERLYQSFDAFRVHHPWVGQDNVRPKSIVRDMFEQVMTFKEFVNHYGLKRSEGVVLRYLSDTYKALNQNVPMDAQTEELGDIVEWLGAVVRQVDSSLIDEWDRLTNPTETGEGEAAHPYEDDEYDVTKNHRAFRVMVRNEMFRWVQMLATNRYHMLPPGEHASEIGPYWDEFDQILIDGDARNADRFSYDQQTGHATQILHDPDDVDAWRIEGKVDFERSAEEGTAVIDWHEAYSL